MPPTLLSTDVNFIQLQDHIKYSPSGIVSQVIIKDEVSQISLFCLAAETEISEHTSTRNATIQVIEGTGTLILKGQEIYLEPGVCVFMAANTPHALKANTNLSFTLTLSSAA